MKYKVTFDVDFQDVKYYVIAKCSDVDSYDVYDLNIKFEDEDGNKVNLPYNKAFFEDVEQMAYEFLYDDKYVKELES